MKTKRTFIPVFTLSVALLLTACNGKEAADTKKTQTTQTEPVANWEKLLEITDAANSYEALSIVFQATINPPTSPTTGY